MRDAPGAYDARMDTPPIAEPDPTERETYTVKGPGVDGTFLIGFPEALAWEEEERIDKLAELVGGHSNISRAFREDREFIVVEAQGMGLSTLDALVAVAWDEAAIGTQYRQFDDAGDLVDVERPNR